MLIHVAVLTSISRFPDASCNVHRPALESRSRKRLASKQNARMIPFRETSVSMLVSPDVSACVESLILR